jgi:acyl carrier protein
MLNEEMIMCVMATILEVDGAAINEDSSMDNVPNWDSLRHMNLVLALEEEFKVSIPDEDAGNITSYKLIKLVLEDLVQQRA